MYIAIDITDNPKLEQSNFSPNIIAPEMILGVDSSELLLRLMVNHYHTVKPDRSTAIFSLMTIIEPGELPNTLHIRDVK